MDIKHGRRKTFDIEYVEVTEENIQEVADWCLGTVVGEGDKRFIRIVDSTARNSRQTKAFIGDVMVMHAGLKTFRAFSRNAFDKAYHEIIPGDVQEVDRSAETGRFVTHAEAEANPDTTVHETILSDASVLKTFDKSPEDGVDPKTLGQIDLPRDADPS